MKKYSIKEVLKLENATRVLAHIVDSDGECWNLCEIEMEGKRVLLKDIDFDGKSHGYLTEVDNTLNEFCEVYEYSEEDAIGLVKDWKKDSNAKKECDSAEEIFKKVLKCPMKVISSVTPMSGAGIFHMGICEENECAWWNETYNCCSAKLIKGAN